MTKQLNPLELAARVLRPQVFVRLIAPFILALAMHNNLRAPGPGVIGALLALSLMWIAATSWNDLSDTGADVVNVRDDPGRPLARGETTRGALRALAIVAAVASLVIACIDGVAVAAVMAGVLVVAAAYSLRPMRLGARPYLPYPALGVAYGAAPYLLALAAMHIDIGARDAAVAGILSAMFAGRMLLKDFRDVRGDELIGKPTFLLRHGAFATTTLAGLLIAAATGALVVCMGLPTWATAATIAYVGATGGYLWRVGHAPSWTDQAVAIILIVRSSAAFFMVLALAAMQNQSQIDASMAALLGALLGTTVVVTHITNIPISAGARRGLRAPLRELVPGIALFPLPL